MHRHHPKAARSVVHFGGVISCAYIPNSASLLFHKLMLVTRCFFGLTVGSWEIVSFFCMTISRGYILCCGWCNHSQRFFWAAWLLGSLSSATIAGGIFRAHTVTNPPAFDQFEWWDQGHLEVAFQVWWLHGKDILWFLLLTSGGGSYFQVDLEVCMHAKDESFWLACVNGSFEHQRYDAT